MKKQKNQRLDSLSNFFPLTRLKLGVWESALHLKDQLFVMILETKFVYVAVHKSQATASPYTNQKLFIDNFQFKDLTWQK